jgi:transposase InsO family protein
VNRLRDLCHVNTPTILQLTRRAEVRQRPQRQLEHAVRQGVVLLTNELLSRGWTCAATAHLLHLCPRTLRQWQDEYHQLPRDLPLRGRPLLRSSRQLRNEVIAVLEELGPATGLPTLRACFPRMARAELADLLRRYRRVWRHYHQHAPYRLRWPVPGRVCSIDFTQAPQPLDGLYPYLLAVRDLGSSQQLLWLPVADLSAAVLLPALTSLFTVYGAPLVLKMDNGSAFLADVTQELLDQFGVIPLFSPPYMPRYNGAIEAGIGSLKTRTANQAARQGRPGQWTCDDAAAAQQEANATARPRGERGPNPDTLWEQRSPIRAEERKLFQTTVERRRNQARAEAGHAPAEPLCPAQERALDRQAIRRALVEHGYLLFSRRRIPLPIKRRKVAKIT